jgi:hypothetical protein
VGTAIYVTIETEISELSWKMDGKTLARHIEKLDRVADKMNVPTLSQMVSVSAHELDDITGDDVQMKEDEKLNPKWVVRFLKFVDFVGTLLRFTHNEQWFDPGAGLATTRLLIAHVRDKQEEFGDDHDWLLRDLENVDRYLTAAAKHNTRFHFSYDI